MRIRSRGTNTDYATVAYDAATGAQLWAQAVPWQAGMWPSASWHVAARPVGRLVFVTGSITGTSGKDYATVAYASI